MGKRVFGVVINQGASWLPKVTIEGDGVTVLGVGSPQVEDRAAAQARLDAALAEAQEELDIGFSVAEVMEAAGWFTPGASPLPVVTNESDNLFLRESEELVRTGSRDDLAVEVGRLAQMVAAMHAGRKSVRMERDQLAAELRKERAKRTLTSGEKLREVRSAHVEEQRALVAQIEECNERLQKQAATIERLKSKPVGGIDRQVLSALLLLHDRAVISAADCVTAITKQIVEEEDRDAA